MLLLILSTLYGRTSQCSFTDPYITPTVQNEKNKIKWNNEIQSEKIKDVENKKLKIPRIKMKDEDKVETYAKREWWHDVIISLSDLIQKIGDKKNKNYLIE